MTSGVYERKSATDRFWDKVDKTGNCWEWTASKRNGYGQFSYRGKTWRAHRFGWFLHYSEIPKGMLICHHCDNPICVNPAHLFLGTHKDNLVDASRKGRFSDRNGEANGFSKLTEEQVLAIRAEYKTGNITQRELAIKYNVSEGAIWDIVNRKNWKHI